MESDVVVMCSAGTIVTDRFVLAVLGERWESVTDTLKMYVPGAVGVPDRLPALFRARPGGKVPEVVLHA